MNAPPDMDSMPPEGMLRVPPHSTEAEQSLLGALMMDNTAWDRIADIITAEHFYLHAHRLIYQHIVRLIERNQPADLITVFESLQSSAKADATGGLPYITSLVNNTASASGIKRYAEIVADKFKLRRLVSIGDEIAEMGFASDAETVDKILRAGALIDALGDTSKQADTVDIRSALTVVIEKIDEMYHSENEWLAGFSTGFVGFDDKLSGMSPGDLIIIAARPSVGKSTLAFQIASHFAIELGMPVYAWSGEMGSRQLVRKLLGMLGKIDGRRLRTGKLTDAEWPMLTFAVQKMQDAQITIDERPGLHINQLRAKARALKRAQGALGLVVVDYVQLMTGTGENRTGEIGSITRGLKQMARELNCPVIALSQLNRGVENRANKRPMMSDLRESGDIEADADIIMLMYRDDLYNPDSPDKGVAEVNIAKNRDGEIGLVPLIFRGEHSWFGTMDYGWRASAPAAPTRAKAKGADA